MTDSLDPTHWSLLEKGDVEHLALRYWEPIRRYLEPRLPRGQDAEDATQTFFLNFLEKELLSRIDRGKGRFRTFLYRVAQQFLVDRYRETSRRGPAVSLDRPDAPDPPDPAAPDPREEFDRHWFSQLLNEARRELKRRYLEQDQAVRYHAFHLYYFGDADPGPWSQKRIAERLGLTVDQTNNYVHRARVLYGKILTEKIRGYASSEEEASELADVRAFLEHGKFHGLPPATVLEIGPAD